MKTDTVFKRAFNDSFDLLSKLAGGGELPSENVLRKHLNVSRTTVRKVLDRFERAGVISRVDGRRFVHSGRQVRKLSKFSDAETVPRAAQIEQRFMEWMLRDNAQAGTAINELDLGRRFGFATTSIREFLNRFQRFGLIEKRPNAGWVFMGITPDFALELFEIREMFELRSAKAFAMLPSESPLWQRMKAIRGEHIALLREVDRRYHDFSDLDNRFHRLIDAAAPNRFIDSFYDIISFIFHYHYQWNKQDERQRNQVALREHINYIDALFSRDILAVRRACKTHLTSARVTLIRSTSGGS